MMSAATKDGGTVPPHVSELLKLPEATAVNVRARAEDSIISILQRLRAIVLRSKTLFFIMIFFCLIVNKSHSRVVKVFASVLPERTQFNRADCILACKSAGQIFYCEAAVSHRFRRVSGAKQAPTLCNYLLKTPHIQKSLCG